MSQILRAYIRKIMVETFQSHTFEPHLGDPVVNVNANCHHHGSRGTVLDIQDLPSDAGKIIVYRVINAGETYSPGDVLEKTLDQLAPDTGMYDIGVKY